jgi:hypothetical protein
VIDRGNAQMKKQFFVANNNNRCIYDTFTSQNYFFQTHGYEFRVQCFISSLRVSASGILRKLLNIIKILQGKNTDEPLLISLSAAPWTRPAGQPAELNKPNDIAHC